LLFGLVSSRGYLVRRSQQAGVQQTPAV